MYKKKAIIPGLDQRDVDSAARVAVAQVKRTRRPQQGDAVGRVVSVQRRVRQEGRNVLRQHKVVLVKVRLLVVLVN